MDNSVLIADEFLVLDEEFASRSLRDEIGEKNIKLLGKATRLRMYLHEPVLCNTDLPDELKSSNANYYSIGLRCALHPDFDHVIEHARITVDFSSNISDALIKNMFPREVTEPVSYKRDYKVTAGLEFSFIKFSGEASQSSEFEFYSPKIKSYGFDSRVGYFDFISTASAELKIDNMLYLLVRLKGEPTLKGKITINATVKVKGSLSLPLVTKKNGGLSEYIRFL